MRRLGYAVLLGVLLVTGCSFVTESGSGNIVTESREVSDFTAISLSGSGKLLVEQGDTESLTITGDDNLIPLLTSEIKDGRLHLGQKNNTSIRPTKQIVYNVKVKSLGGVDLSGSGNIDLKDLKGKQLEVGVSGSGSLTATGEVDRLNLRISGSGKSDTEGLKCKAATIRVSGSGNIVVAASETLDVKVSGSGSVKYVGDPTVTQRISGSGSVRKR